MHAHPRESMFVQTDKSGVFQQETENKRWLREPTVIIVITIVSVVCLKMC